MQVNRSVDGQVAGSEGEGETDRQNERQTVE